MADDSLLISAWAPGLMGFAVSGMMYGATLGQTIYYARFFPRDSRNLKFLVFTVFLADTVHLISCAQHYWLMLVGCHRKYTKVCENGISWGILALMVLDVMITFVVQCFYSHRIWIITGRNKILTGIVLVVATLAFGSGVWYIVASYQHESINFAFTTPVILPLAILRTVDDFVITGTVFKYMWKSGFRNRHSAVRDIAVIFVNMGMFTCVISIILGIVYLSQGNADWVSAVGVCLSRGYVNSMLGVLNARKTIRDRNAGGNFEFELAEVSYSFT